MGARARVRFCMLCTAEQLLEQPLDLLRHEILARLLVRVRGRGRGRGRVRVRVRVRARVGELEPAWCWCWCGDRC